MSILELFCSVDDFWHQLAPSWHQDLLSSGQRQRLRPTQLHPSEIMTIVILFHQSHYRTFKAYYTEYVQRHLQSEFPTLVSYQRFVELMPTILVPLVAYLHTQLGRCTGISFIDSTPLAVCHNARIHQHRVFAGRAARGKDAVLVDEGLATYESAIDRRTKNVCITEKGRELLEKLAEYANEWVARITQTLSVEELTDLTLALEKVRAVLAEDYAYRRQRQKQETKEISYAQE